jgi:acetolactate synthase I/II/III large subunit
VARSKKSALNRRNFLQSATVGAATLAAGGTGRAQQLQPGTPRVVAPNAAAREAETGTPPSNVEILTNERPGSDFMVDVLKSLGIEYICSNPGSSFRALHESVINYGGNRNPEFLTCCHEESAVGMAHGYSKIEGKPLVVFAHGTVGLQHAAMAIYNAYCDRVPVYVIFGNLANAATRRPGVEWAHSVQDGASLVRDFVKWDDAPASLTHFAESAVRAYKIAMTPPTMPIVPPARRRA